jgi:hypothetical protein
MVFSVIVAYLVVAIVSLPQQHLPVQQHMLLLLLLL